MLPRLSATDTDDVLSQNTLTTIKLPAALGVWKATLFVRPRVTSAAPAWTKDGVAAPATGPGAAAKADAAITLAATTATAR